jgi:type VI secretion system protein ImpJ
MRNLPVHWSEGLFLRPHHFQAADRYWTEALSACEQWDHAYHYGLRSVELSEEAIANHQVQLNSCNARMTDGTLVALEPGQGPDRVDLKEAFDRESVVRVYLAIPKLTMGAVNVAPEQQPGKSRYVQRVHAPQDESSGGNDQEVRFRDLNVRLMLSTQDTSGYDLLPLVQLRRAGEKGATPRIDPEYFPPVLACDAWPPLGRDMVRAIYDILGQKIEVLAAQVISRGITLASQQPGDLDRMFMLAQLNRAYATLNIVAFARGVHPFHAYTECCRIVGQLSIFGPERRVVDIPRYDHDDLYTIFAFVRRQIQLLLNALPDYEYEQEFFLGEGPGMSVALNPKWLGNDWQWFVGVLHGADLTDQACMQLLTGEGGLDWKLGSAPQVDALFRFGAEGLSLKPLRQAPRALPTSRGWLYYEVTRGNAAWKDVLHTQTLAMRVNDGLIVNRDTLQGKRDLVVRVGPRQVPLQFALFAVPNAPSTR